MKICFVSRKWPPAMGGMETYSKELSTALEAHGTVERIVLPGNEDGSVPGAMALLGFGLRAAARLIFASGHYDVVHVADMASWPLALAARLGHPRAVRVLSAHGTDVSYPLRGGLKGRLYGAYLRLGARLLGGVTVVANSNATAKQTMAQGFEQVSIVPLASNAAAEGAGPAGRHVLFSGRLLPLKGASWFVREVLERLPEDITLHVAGTAWDAGERAALEHPRVTYLGKLDQSDLWRAFAEAMCVVVPNIKVPNGTFEGFGLVAVEAAASGGVVLAADHGGLSDAVLPGETGFLVPSGDAEAWAAKIENVATWSEQERAAYTQKATLRAQQHFRWDRVAAETAAYYRAGTVR